MSFLIKFFTPKEKMEKSQNKKSVEKIKSKIKLVKKLNKYNIRQFFLTLAFELLPCFCGDYVTVINALKEATIWQLTKTSEYP